MGRILVVDDVAANRAFVSLHLMRVGHEADACGSAEAALERLAAETFDLVLMDLRMPGMDGLAAARAIRSGGSPNRAVPIVAITADDTAAQFAECRAAGMDDMVAKPVDPEALAATVERWLGVGFDAAAGEDPETAEIRAAYALHLRTVADEVRCELEKLGSQGAAAGLRRLADIGHAVAGTAGSLGFAEVSGAAAELMRASGAAKARAAAKSLLRAIESTRGK